MNLELKPPKQGIDEATLNLHIALINLRNKTVDRPIKVTSLMGYLKEKQVIYYAQDIAEILISKHYVTSEGVLKRRNIQWVSKLDIDSDLALEIIMSAQEHRKDKMRTHHKRRKEYKAAIDPAPIASATPANAPAEPVITTEKKPKKIKKVAKLKPNTILETPNPSSSSSPNFLKIVCDERNDVKTEHEQVNEEIIKLQKRLDILSDRLSSLDMLIETYQI